MPGPRRLTVAAPSPLQVGAYQDGRAAFIAGVDTTVCPHRGPQGDPELLLLWIRGWVAAQYEQARAEQDPPSRHPSIAALAGRREPG